jgi:hypothetical protein
MITHFKQGELRMKSNKNEWLEGFWLGWSSAMAGALVLVIILLVLKHMLEA